MHSMDERARLTRHARRWHVSPQNRRTGGSLSTGRWTIGALHYWQLSRRSATAPWARRHMRLRQVFEQQRARRATNLCRSQPGQMIHFTRLQPPSRSRQSIRAACAYAFAASNCFRCSTSHFSGRPRRGTTAPWAAATTTSSSSSGSTSSSRDSNTNEHRLATADPAKPAAEVESEPNTLRGGWLTLSAAEAARCIALRQPARHRGADRRRALRPRPRSTGRRTARATWCGAPRAELRQDRRSQAHRAKRSGAQAATKLARIGAANSR